MNVNGTFLREKSEAHVREGYIFPQNAKLMESVRKGNKFGDCLTEHKGEKF